jgi:hypothetical protein
VRVRLRHPKHKIGAATWDTHNQFPYFMTAIQYVLRYTRQFYTYRNQTTNPTLVPDRPQLPIDPSSLAYYHLPANTKLELVIHLLMMTWPISNSSTRKLHVTNSGLLTPGYRKPSSPWFQWLIADMSIHHEGLYNCFSHGYVDHSIDLGRKSSDVATRKNNGVSASEWKFGINDDEWRLLDGAGDWGQRPIHQQLS